METFAGKWGAPKRGAGWKREGKFMITQLGRYGTEKHSQRRAHSELEMQTAGVGKKRAVSPEANVQVKSSQQPGN